MSLFSAVGKQLQHPRGLFGRALFRWLTISTFAHARWTADLMDVQPDDDVLEVGFGNGANLGLLAERASRGTVAGAEVSETAIEMATKNNRKAIAEGRMKLHHAAGGRLPFADGAFDKTCTVATAYVIADPGAVFREMHRVLRPGGFAAVTFPVRENFMRFKPAGADGFHLHELADLESAFRDAGFVDRRTERNDAVKFGAHCMLGRKAAAG